MIYNKKIGCYLLRTRKIGCYLFYFVTRSIYGIKKVINKKICNAGLFLYIDVLLPSV